MDNIKMNSGKNTVRTQSSSRTSVSQPTQKNQFSSDAVYQEIITNDQTGAEYELDPMTSVHTQQSQNEYQSLHLKQTGHNDESQYQGIQKNRAESGNTKFKKEVQRMKLVLAVMMIVNIVMLLLVTAVAILGTCGIQGLLLKSGQCTGRQNVSTSQFSQLIALTQDNISMQLDTINSDISHLRAVVYNNISTELNQAHTCKTLGVVTTPKSVASRRIIIHPRTRVAQCSARVVCTYIQISCLGAGRGRELACKSREVLRFLALEPVRFRQQQLTRSFSLSGVRSDLPLYTKNICWCSLPQQRWPRIAVKGVYRHNFRPVHF